MIAKLTRTGGGLVFHNCESVVHHAEEGKKGWIECRGRWLSNKLDTHFSEEGLKHISVWDHGTMIWEKSFR